MLSPWTAQDWIVLGAVSIWPLYRFFQFSAIIYYKARYGYCRCTICRNRGYRREEAQ